MLIGPFNTETSKKASAHKRRMGEGKVKRENQQKKLSVEKDNSLIKIYGNPSE